ncbi:MAG: endonuclease [Rhodospirillales bacterium]|nr:endonuclease [Rhodospirillales bacterium]
MTDDEVLERLEQRTNILPSGCWVWTGRLTRDGYGQMSVRGRTEGAHRLSYRAHHGGIPQGLQIDHLCRNRACLNPAHLRAVTHRVNTMAGFGVGALNAAKTACLRGHQFTGENHRVAPDGERVCRPCANIRLRAHRARRLVCEPAHQERAA